MLLALDPQGRRTILLFVDAKDDPFGIVGSRTMGVGRVFLEDNGIQRLFLAATCRSAELHSVLDYFISDLGREIFRSASATPSDCFVRVWNRWRALFERERQPELGEEALVGLWGELHVLQRLADFAPAALVSWVGPDSQSHDFISARASLEVKTSRLREGRLFEIHGVDQLAHDSQGPLFLVAMKVEASPEGTSVPQLVESLLATGLDGEDFLGRLARVGYFSAHATAYVDHRYKLKERRLYRISGDFPRITTESFVDGRLPPGTIRLRYTIDLTSEPPLPEDEATAQAVFESIARSGQ